METVGRGDLLVFREIGIAAANICLSHEQSGQDKAY